MDSHTGLGSNGGYGCDIGVGRSQAGHLELRGRLVDREFRYLSLVIGLCGSDSGSGLGYSGPFDQLLGHIPAGTGSRECPSPEVFREFQYQNLAMLQQKYVNEWFGKQNCTRQGQLLLSRRAVNA